ncbi:hypothetical protein MNEG_15382 [Monoraphidium neglectum]|uniref:CBM20 domain-containing protein n=1 Tax=Monoraphidium neglectum TaxID=145388 RepID=A0A0D2MB78_9CHLO|nr:hypothetical protein MNEG_15382 [Monoraphidium neglectum]KIY92580.1 hypothetical protein MNEG_15382 [Monoraphidium neglectum]|eukprot:XP_013891600.1 hypothetical protein MNEG_15382 [Monoraphidium neglectum]
MSGILTRPLQRGQCGAASQQLRSTPSRSLFRPVAALGARSAPGAPQRRGPAPPPRRGASAAVRYRNGDKDAIDAIEKEADAVAEDMLIRETGKDLVPVEIILGHHCEWGQRFAIVGDCEALGSWDVARAAPLQWHDGGSDGDLWSAVVPLPPNHPVAFKPVVVSDADGSCIAWADDVTGGAGRNMTVTVTEGAEGEAGAHVELLPETSGEALSVTFGVKALETVPAF